MHENIDWGTHFHPHPGIFDFPLPFPLFPSDSLRTFDIFRKLRKESGKLSIFSESSERHESPQGRGGFARAGKVRHFPGATEKATPQREKRARGRRLFRAEVWLFR